MLSVAAEVDDCWALSGRLSTAFSHVNCAFRGTLLQGASGDYDHPRKRTSTPSPPPQERAGGEEADFIEYPSSRSFLAGRGRRFLVVVSRCDPTFAQSMRF